VSIHLSVAAHTNAGKTTLVRTLLKRDIGEVADRPHVTDSAERFLLLDTAAGDALYLWDTPGFGDSVRLEKRLRESGNPVGWFLTQVWDRLVDRPFYCSQQVMDNVRAQSDVVLYVVNASEDASALAYLEAELRILRWIGKPVLLLLNQTGQPQKPEAEAADEARWSGRLAQHVAESGILTLDAFARFWTREDQLLASVGKLVAETKREELERLRAGWRERNLATFRASMGVLARNLAFCLADRERVPEKLDAGALAARVKRLFARDAAARNDPALESAMSRLAERLDARIQEDTDRLISLHGLSGRARRGLLERARGQFEVAEPLNVANSGLAGMVTGAAGGLAVDLAVGGVTLGTAALLGAVLGALGIGGAAKAYNVLQGQDDGSVRWGVDFATQRLRTLLLLYLSVAHFGRGRGEWSEGPVPEHWRAQVAEVVQAWSEPLAQSWRDAADGEGAEALSARLETLVASVGRETIERLYPESRALFVAASPA
jgi:hypothetical protein